ncbi:hypothetical protein ANN_08844 [Periplaneta americana]|uniref:Reverse transcriptase n=1 Tax=Periplaneta americana TaxID=6978 RepID=A0ABQ8T2J3_PERAM|nr:hypothetical protein ANN_08844 [Periplaneta americana]
MGNACYYSVEKLLSSNLLSKSLKVRIYKTVILPVVLYGYETWTLTLREEQRLRVLENKVLRKIFGAKRDEVTGEWRKLHNAELHALYTSPDIIRNIKSRRLRWAGHVAHMGESRNAYRVLVGRPEGKRPLGRPRRRWEDNIKMDLREVGYDGEAPCKADLNNFKGKSFRVSIPGPLVERTSALPLSYPGTPPDTISTFPFISTQLAWADETPETHNECTQSLCDLELWFSVNVQKREFTPANKWIRQPDRLTSSEWRQALKMTANVCPLRAIPGRSRDGNHCRRCVSEIETLGHVLGACPFSETLRDSRHHRIRSMIAEALRKKALTVHEEVHGISQEGSCRRIDILAIPPGSTSAFKA